MGSGRRGSCYLPAGHRLLGRKVCRVEQCTATAHYNYPDICHRCFTRLTRMGMTMDDIAARESLPAAPVPAPHCAVPECRCVPTVRGAVMCEPHAQNSSRQAHSDDRRGVRASIREFGLTRRAGLLRCRRARAPQTGRSATAAPTINGGVWPSRTHPGLDEQSWRTRESGVAEPGQVNLRTLPELVVVEVLIGLQTRLRDGLRLTDVVLRAVCDTLRRHQVVSIHDCDPKLAPGRRATSIMTVVRARCPPHARRSRRRTGKGHLGSGDLRPSREAVVHRDHPALAVRRCEAVGGRTTAASPRQRRLACPGQDQQPRVAVRTPRSPTRPRPGPIRPWAPRPGGVPQPARPPGVHRPDRPLPTQHDLPRRAAGAGRNPIPGTDPARAAGRRTARRLRHRTRRHPRRSRTRRTRTLPARRDHDRTVREPRHPRTRRSQSRHPDRHRHRPPARGHSQPHRWTAWTATKTAVEVLVYDNIKANRLRRRCRSARQPPRSSPPSNTGSGSVFPTRPSRN